MAFAAFARREPVAIRFDDVLVPVRILPLLPTVDLDWRGCFWPLLLLAPLLLLPFAPPLRPESNLPGSVLSESRIEDGC